MGTPLPPSAQRERSQRRHVGRSWPDDDELGSSSPQPPSSSFCFSSSPSSSSPSSFSFSSLHLQHSIVSIIPSIQHFSYSDIFWQLDSTMLAEVSARRWIWDHVPSLSVMFRLIFQYTLTLMPLPLWILSYNWLYLWEDTVAGIALSLVVIPQSIGFGIMSQISPMHGLYSTFAGLALY